MARIALKIDVDTWRGTREGVPGLVALLRRHDAPASFLFSLGPDHTGRAIARAFRPGFLGKVARTSVLEHYGLRTLMYGVLLPGPDIGRREAGTLRAVRDAGFEVGIHCWDHVRWQDGLVGHDDAWALAEMRRAAERFQDVFGEPARLHGAAGWQFHAGAARAEAALGIAFASDTRGDSPFQPVDEQGVPIGPPQYPTTLPTLDEKIGLDGIDRDNVHASILQMTQPAAGREVPDQVFTLHAELEGMRLRPVLDRLLTGWRAQGHQLVSMGQLHEAWAGRELPRRRIVQAEVPGRSGLLAVQGA